MSARLETPTWSITQRLSIYATRLGLEPLNFCIRKTLCWRRNIWCWWDKWRSRDEGGVLVSNTEEHSKISGGCGLHRASGSGVQCGQAYIYLGGDWGIGAVPGVNCWMPWGEGALWAGHWIIRKGQCWDISYVPLSSFAACYSAGHFISSVVGNKECCRNLKGGTTP